jgi:hypothetical protein
LANTLQLGEEELETAETELHVAVDSAEIVLVAVPSDLDERQFLLVHEGTHADNPFQPPDLIDLLVVLDDAEHQ